jgi:hypothetical protein
MVNSIIALDSEDGALGAFFSICSNIVSTVIKDAGNGKWTYIEMPTRSLNEMNLELKTAQFSGRNFVFSSFTHGSEDTLFVNGTRVIYSPCQPNYLANSLAFCFACSSGKTLGADLVSTGTLCFMGYNTDVSIWSTYLQTFAECATEAISAFYKGKSVKESLEAKIQKYNYEIDNIYLKNFPVAALLMENRDAITVYGDDSLTVDKFLQ